MHCNSPPCFFYPADAVARARELLGLRQDLSAAGLIAEAVKLGMGPAGDWSDYDQRHRCAAGAAGHAYFDMYMYIPVHVDCVHIHMQCTGRRLPHERQEHLGQAAVAGEAARRSSQAAAGGRR